MGIDRQFSGKHREIVDYMQERAPLFFQRREEMREAIMQEPFDWGTKDPPQICGYTAGAITDAITKVFSGTKVRTAYGHYAGNLKKQHYWTDVDSEENGILLDGSYGQFMRAYEKKILIVRPLEAKNYGLVEYPQDAKGSILDELTCITLRRKGKIDMKQALKGHVKTRIDAYRAMCEALLR